MYVRSNRNYCGSDHVRIYKYIKIDTFAAM